MIEDSLLNNQQRTDKYVVGELVPANHPKLNYLRHGALVGKFDGIETFLDYLKEKMPNHGSGDRDSSSTHRSEEPDFYTFETYEQAMEIFRTKPETIAKFDETELRIKDVNETGNTVNYDVVGDYIDMGRYMEGVPESFGSLYDGNARNRRINIIVVLNHVADTKETDINYRSERVLRLVDALEVGGARCMITGISSTECEHVEVTIKRHEESLVINDLAVLAHSEMLRRMMFRFKEHSKTWSWGYGSPYSFSRAVSANDLENDNVNEITVFIDGSMHNQQTIGRKFDQVERLLQWELSKSVPEVTAVKIDNYGVHFADNGSRDAAEIQREGKEVLNNE